ncbi:hypothetical protein FS837_001691 [Tulasnella sp. UAMH 9824]|nr:hypothetical protein FS837_001691 [Tulasnella sp. UAMH 9824]
MDPELDFWDLVEPTTSRWEKATLTLHEENTAKVCSTLAKGLPNVKHLTLESEFFPEDVTLGPTPRLAELYLNRQITLDISDGTTLSALRRLVIKSVSPSSAFIMNFLPTLTECPLLELLHLDSISSITFDDTILFGALDVSLPRLQILRIEAVTVPFAATLLRHLRADGLEQLRVHCRSEGDDIAALRSLGRPDGKGLILPVLSNRRGPSEICLTLSDEWIRVEDLTGRLFLDFGLEGLRNHADLLRPVVQDCANATRRIAITVRLYHVMSLNGLHILCEASPMVTSIHCYDRGRHGSMYRCVLRSGTGQTTCQTCYSTEHEDSIVFPRLSELRLYVPHIASLLPTYNQQVQLAYLSRPCIGTVAPLPLTSPLEQNSGLKIYINDTFMPPDPASLFRDPWAMPSFLQFDF